MIIKSIDAKTLQKAFLAGAKSIEARKEYINELNVFPVPDGDTGTNMTLTIMSAAKEVSQLENPSVAELCKAISSGSLRGARGNSGVILSQLFRGFTKEITAYEEITVDTLANGFERAVETAYKAVMKPKEGTILTVAKGGATKATELVGKTDNIVEFGEKVIEHMQQVLSETPEMLPVLKEAGVVDSGGQGLLEVVKGAFDAILGKEVDFVPSTPVVKKVSNVVDTENIATSDIKFGYCTEFIVMLEKEYNATIEHEFKSYLESIGDSLVVVSDDEIVKVHVHTNDPGLAIQKGLTYGSLTSMKIDNMREEHHERLIANASKVAEEKKEEAPKVPEKRKEVGFIAVSIGEGVNEIFKGLGVDYLIEGGQTMNPSTEDMLNAIDQVNADTIFILPNNSNISMIITSRGITPIDFSTDNLNPASKAASLNMFSKLSISMNLEHVQVIKYPPLFKHSMALLLILLYPLYAFITVFLDFVNAGGSKTIISNCPFSISSKYLKTSAFTKDILSSIPFN